MALTSIAATPGDIRGNIDPSDDRDTQEGPHFRRSTRTVTKITTEQRSPDRVSANNVPQKRYRTLIDASIMNDPKIEFSLH
jgi:hypothetical protein